jgi:hypothetical protein
MKYSKGIMWLDDCRIPFVNEISIKISGDRKHLQKWKERDGRTPRNIDEIDNTPYENTQGRFTPNLLVCDDMLNDGVITKQSKRTYKPTEHSGSLFGNSPQAHGVGIGDSGSSSRYYDLDKWFDKVIDEIQ